MLGWLSDEADFASSTEAPEAILVLDEIRRQDLERDVALEASVLRQVHLAHAARAERGHDPVMGDLVLGAQRSLGLSRHHFLASLR